MKNSSAIEAEVTTRSVSVYINSQLSTLTGSWMWEMQSDAVFCSDVMFFPPDFVGTKAIIHPDDVAYVNERLLFLAHVETIDCRFRIITTYGEVKHLYGEEIALSIAAPAIKAEPGRQLAQRIEEHPKWQRMVEKLKYRKLLHEQVQRITTTGEWYYNSASGTMWFSDHVYHIYGVAPQSLNAHIHTFSPFIHPEDADTVKDAIDRCLQEHLPLHIEFKIIRVDGEERYVRLMLSWVFNSDGEEILCGVTHDITDTKTYELACDEAKNEANLQEQMLQFNEPLANLANWHINLITRKVTLSDNFYRIFGLKPQSVKAAFTSFLNYVHIEDRKRIAEAWLNIISMHTPPDIEFRIVKSNGKTAHIRQKAKLAIYGGVEMVMLGAIQDVTALKQNEWKVNELTAKLELRDHAISTAEQATRIVSWTWDLDNNETTWSENLQEILGIKVMPVPADYTKIINLILQEDKKKFTDALSLASTEHRPADFDVQMLIKGELHHMHAIFRVLEHEKKKMFLGLIRDTTEEQEYRRQLKERTNVAEALADNINDRIFITDNYNTIILWNRQSEAYYNIAAENAVGKNLFDVFPNMKAEEDYNLLNRSLKGEIVSIHGRHAQARKLFYDYTLMPLTNELKKVWGVLHVQHDVTREVHLKEQLTHRLSFIEKLLETSIDRIVVLDRQMNVQYWNKKAEEYFMVQKDQIIGHNFMDIFPGFISDPMYAACKKAFKGEQVHIPPALSDDHDKMNEDTYLLPIKNDLDQVTDVMWLVKEIRDNRLQMTNNRATTGD